MRDVSSMFVIITPGMAIAYMQLWGSFCILRNRHSLAPACSIRRESNVYVPKWHKFATSARLEQKMGNSKRESNVIQSPSARIDPITINPINVSIITRGSGGLDAYKSKF